MSEPIWIAEARKYIGLKETPGAANNPTIISWLKRLKAWWADDATPWCGTYVAACLDVAGIKAPKEYYRAKSYATWGLNAGGAVYGCIVVFERKGGGHVGFVVGKDTNGRIMVLGGNQGDAVSIAPFDPARAIAYRWPNGLPFTTKELPTIFSTAQSSKNEA